MAHLNIEIKARSSDQERIREILFSEKADFKGTDHQIDTYFRVNSGRLKLREGNIENNLIHYQREDMEGPKRAEVTLFRTAVGSSLKEILVRSLGVLIVVDKTREIYFIGNVKFHLDQVKNLGSFVEIEAIDDDGTIGKELLYQQCNRYLQLLNIPPGDLVPVSYSDLLLQSPE
jgi:predicted adenylyl cyclase CyaB